MNYREMLVKNNLKELGYEVGLNNIKGYPDFKVFSFSTKEAFYVEVKSNITKHDSQIIYTFPQKEVFKQLVDSGETLYIAIVREGKIVYKKYPTMEIWKEFTYGVVDYDQEKLKCSKCGHEWLPKKANPRVCPRCKCYRKEITKCPDAQDVK